MCGIAGFLGSGDKVDPQQYQDTARRMADTLTHRGPDDAGVWTDPDAGVALGHRRLSIIDLSPQGHQPMVSACGRYMIVYNGEIYNFRAIRRELEDQDTEWRGTSDTEVLLAAITRWGVEVALPRLNGMFAFALWDRQARTLTLARDRFGEKPLYYGRFGDSFVFGSEVKALHAHPAFEATIDAHAFGLYLRHGYIPAPHSIFKQVRKLPPAHGLKVRPDGEAEIFSYWDASAIARSTAAEPFSGTEQDAVGELDGRLREAVSMRMEADVPLGAFLSGGIDSSTVVSLMQDVSTRPVKTFTIGYADKQYSEAEHAKAVAEHLGTEHTELYATENDALALVSKLPQYHDEPFADVSALPTTLLSHLTREHVTVALSGDGGDELFCGYGQYPKTRDNWERLRRKSKLFKGSAAFAGRQLAGLAPANQLGARMLKDAHFLELNGCTDLADYFGGSLSAWWSRELGAGSAQSSLYESGRGAGPEEPIRKLMYLDSRTYLPDDILVKVDRASMSASLEARAPLLDHHLVEFAWSLPTSMLLRDGTGKWLLRQVLDRYVPRPLVDRPKMGFDVPVGAWLRGALRDWAEDLLQPSMLRDQGLFNHAAVRRRWREHLGGRRDRRFFLWRVLMFQAWSRAWLKG